MSRIICPYRLMRPLATSLRLGASVTTFKLSITISVWVGLWTLQASQGQLFYAVGRVPIPPAIAFARIRAASRMNVLIASLDNAAARAIGKCCFWLNRTETVPVYAWTARRFPFAVFAIASPWSV